MEKKKILARFPSGFSPTIHPRPGSEIKSMQQVGAKETAQTRRWSSALQLTAPLTRPSCFQPPFPHLQSRRLSKLNSAQVPAVSQSWLLLSSSGYLLTAGVHPRVLGRALWLGQNSPLQEKSSCTWGVQSRLRSHKVFPRGGT